MARGINKAILVGNLGADPETRYTQSGGAVTNVSLATAESWRDKQSGEQQERTEWHRIVFFGRLAEIASEYLRKGSQVYVEGRIQTRKWQGQDGQDRWTTEIVANEMQMLGGRGGSQGESQGGSQGGSNFGGGGGRGGSDGPPADENWSGGESSGGRGRAAAPASSSGETRRPAPAPSDEFDDDIPF